MEIALVVAALAAGVALVRGGSLERLAATHFRWLPLLFAALAVQVGFSVWDPPGVSEAGRLGIVLGSTVGVATFLTLNRHLAGTLVAALGLSLNVLVIGLNGAMPVSESAVRIAGGDPTAIGGIKHELMTDETQLGWLGDVIPIPRWSIISIGDALLAVGLARLTYRQTRHGRVPGAPRPSGRRSGPRGGTGAPRTEGRTTRRGERAGGSAPAAPPAPPPSPRRPG